MSVILSDSIEQDKNLLVVAAVEGYALNHSTDAFSAYTKLKQHNILSLIRNQYEVLHTQPLEETVAFTEDVMKRNKWA